MSYKVIKGFIDLTDNRHDYNEGDVYPRIGYTTTDERIEVLLGENPKGVQYIEEIDDNELTVAELKAELKAKGIEVPKKAKKSELQALLSEHSEE